MTQAYHFIGIGGIGMSALAYLLLDCGYSVSGLDSSMNKTIARLRSKGAFITIGNDVSIPVNSTVVYSTAISEDHISLRRARKETLPLLHRSELLAKLMQKRRSLLIAGTHGKTGTTALLTHLLEVAGLSPSSIIGGLPVGKNQNGKSGEGEYFVAEADESDGSFLHMRGYGGIVTNIDTDHLDFWENSEALVAGFHSFIENISTPSHFFWCCDNPLLLSLYPKGVSFGRSRYAKLRLIECIQKKEGICFTALFGNYSYRNIFLPLLGEHQATNALAVLGMGIALGISEKQIREAFQTFPGVHRRLEKIGEEKGIVVYDDYAHHPTAISAVLDALKKGGKEKGMHRLVAIIEPHRFSRVYALRKEFITAVAGSDLLIITDIFAAGEKPIPEVNGITLSKAIPGSYYFSKEKLLEGILPLLSSGDMVVTLGAGSITHFGPRLLGALK